MWNEPNDLYVNGFNIGLIFVYLVRAPLSKNAHEVKNRAKKNDDCALFNIVSNCIAFNTQI